MDEAIRVKLLDFMRAKSISQSELAQEIGVSRQAINDLVKGRRGAIPQSLSDALSALGLELEVVERRS